MSPGGPPGPEDGTRGLPARVPARLRAHVAADAPVCVAYSGGLDSTVLLEIVARARTWRVTAVHVHHGLSPNADAWAAHCASTCATLDVPLEIVRVDVDRASGLGLEGAARKARYAAYASREAPDILLAHHRDDQAETVLLQLVRGTGLRGAAAMPEARARGAKRLVRPMLPEPRAVLLAYARESDLAWIEDESNASTAHDRNFLRLEVAPRLDLRFAGWRDALGRFAHHAAEADGLLRQLAALDGVPSVPGEPMRLHAGLDAARRANALRAFLAAHAVPMPGESQLAEMARQLYDAATDARVELRHAGIVVRRHRGAAYVDPVESHAASWRVAWREEASLVLGAGRGSIEFRPVIGAGLSRAALAGGERYFAPRSGGERLRVPGARCTRTLKNLLQESDIPAWERDRLPLLFHDGRLAWVPGVGIAAEHACAPGEPGLAPSWRVAGKAPLC